LALDLLPPGTPVLADSTQLERTFVNLVDNALVEGLGAGSD
jgi:signal transduction histidine kinase